MLNSRYFHKFIQVLNLFLALLLSSFGASNLSQAPSDTADTKKLQEAIDRFSRASNWLKNFLLQVLKVKLFISTPTNLYFFLCNSHAPLISV